MCMIGAIRVKLKGGRKSAKYFLGVIIRNLIKITNNYKVVTKSAREPLDVQRNVCIRELRIICKKVHKL